MGGGRHGMGRMDGASGQNDVFPIVKFRITGQVSDSPALPAALIPLHRLTATDVTHPDTTVPITIGMRHMAFNLNGKTFEMQNYSELEKIPLNSVQRIKISHDNQGMGGGMRGGRGGGMGMMMALPHPIHIHGQQFQILSRKQNNQGGAYDTVKDGFINSGWKDTVLVMPGEEVEIIKPFKDYSGLFLYHCHNLEHEDMGMMRNYFIS